MINLLTADMLNIEQLTRSTPQQNVNAGREDYRAGLVTLDTAQQSTARLQVRDYKTGRPYVVSVWLNARQISGSPGDKRAGGGVSCGRDSPPDATLMDEVWRWLDSAALVIAGAPISWAEVLGAVSGLACVALVARQHVWNWPVGLVNNVFWALLFWRAKLYSDSTLQGIFFALGCYGWWRWRPGAAGDVLAVRRTRRREWGVLATAVVVATAGLAAWLAHATDSPAPLADATVLTLPLAATWGQAEKLIESWWI